MKQSMDGRGTLVGDSNLQGNRDEILSVLSSDGFYSGETRGVQQEMFLPVFVRDLQGPPGSWYSKSQSSKSVLDFNNVEKCLINDIARVRDTPDCPYRLQQESRSAADQMFEDMPVRIMSAGMVESGLHLQSNRGAVSDSGGLFAGSDASPQLLAGCSDPSSWKSYAACLSGGEMQKTVLSDVRVDDSRSAVELAGLKAIPINFPQILDDGLKMKDKVGIKCPMIKDGRPAIILSEEELSELSKPLHLSLIGKFPSGRPKWLTVTKFFSSLNLKGEFKIANLDARHMHIHLQLADDYIRLFSKQFLHINGFLIKFLKWTLDFNVHAEPPICPVWISLPLLGLHLYTPSMLFSIASIYGRPLRLDYATSHWTRPENARILVEMDITRRHSNEIWIGSESNGYVQKVYIENLPRFCEHCRKLGHSNDKCFRIFPELRKEQMHMNNHHPHHDFDVVHSEDTKVDKGVASGGYRSTKDLMALGNQELSASGEALVFSDQDGGVKKIIKCAVGLDCVTASPNNVNVDCVVGSDSNNGLISKGTVCSVLDDCDDSMQQTALGVDPTGEAQQIVSLVHDYCIDSRINVRGSSMSSGRVPDVCIVQPASVSLVENVQPLDAYAEVPPDASIVEVHLGEDPDLMHSALGNVDRSPRDSPVNRTPQEYVGLHGSFHAENITQELSHDDISNEVDLDLGPNYQDRGRVALWSFSDGDEADPDGDESFLRILLENSRRLRIANGIRSPIITRSHTKRERDNDI